jgi:hypothetical protein
VAFIVVAMEREVTVWFRQQPKEFYVAGFQGIMKRCVKQTIYQLLVTLLANT